MLDYEALLREGSQDVQWSLPDDERDAIALNYTSGTTGDPKGVVTHHRGAYLNSLAQIITWSMPQNPVYLWTLPMFHCNGWCFPWAIAAQGGVNVCLRRVDPPAVLDLIEARGVSHMCGAPIVYSMLIDEMVRQGKVLSRRLDGMVAGAAPPSALIKRGSAAASISRMSMVLPKFTDLRRCARNSPTGPANQPRTGPGSTPGRASR